MKRRILLVDDEVAILLTLKAVLEISGFQVDTAASAKEARLKLKHTAYAMVITDMRMESDEAGRAVIRAARTADSHPAIALLTAFPMAEEDWQEMGADKMLVKPMQIQMLLQQIEALLKSHEDKLGAAAPVPSDELLRSAKPISKTLSKTAASTIPSKTARQSVARKLAAVKRTSRKTPPGAAKPR